ncbi:MAG: hypothetical protein ABH871_02620 [Pseudomonadota bacterium]
MRKALILALILFSGCLGEGFAMSESNRSDNPVQIKKIIYQFHDASVPPQYHRSYVITVTPGMAKIVIDSYGDILAGKQNKITEKQFEGIVKSLRKNGIKNVKLKDNEGCTGGTGESISYSDEQKEIFSGTVYHCGGIDSGNLGGDIKSFAEDVKKLIKKWPDTKK